MQHGVYSNRETPQKAYAVSQINIYSLHFYKSQNTSTPLVSMAIQRELLQMGDGDLNQSGSQKKPIFQPSPGPAQQWFPQQLIGSSKTACKCSESLQLLQLLPILRCIKMLRTCVWCHHFSKDCVNRPLVHKPLTIAVPPPSYTVQS